MPEPTKEELLRRIAELEQQVQRKPSALEFRVSDKGVGRGEKVRHSGGKKRRLCAGYALSGRQARYGAGWLGRFVLWGLDLLCAVRLAFHL